jgi:hypothetical protein
MMRTLFEDSALGGEDILFNIKTAFRRYFLYQEINCSWSSFQKYLYPSMPLSAHNMTLR